MNSYFSYWKCDCGRSPPPPLMGEECVDRTGSSCPRFHSLPQRAHSYWLVCVGEWGLASTLDSLGGLPPGSQLSRISWLRITVAASEPTFPPLLPSPIDKDSRTSLFWIPLYFTGTPFEPEICSMDFPPGTLLHWVSVYFVHLSPFLLTRLFPFNI